MSKTTDLPEFDPVPALASELALASTGIAAVIRLLDTGGTVPFIARYRKEATGGLDEVQIRTIAERRAYLVELEQRRAAILASIDEQGKLSPELRRRITACASKQSLEDLYLPFKPKRRSKAAIAREKGLGPLAERVLAQPRDGDPMAEAAGFIDPSKDVPDADAAMKFARDIVVERVVEDPEVRSFVRKAYAQRGILRTVAAPGKVEVRSKFEDWYDYAEPASGIPSHRYLAIRRGENEGVLRSKIEVDPDLVQPAVERTVGLDPRSPFADYLRAAARVAVKGRLAIGLETDVRVELKGRADREAVDVFAENLENLLLAAPLGAVPVIGIDPGLRSGCKCAAVDGTGRYVETITIYPARGKAGAEKAAEQLAAFVAKHRPRAIAVGNGTGGRETEALTREVVSAAGLRDEIVVVAVSEAGASVYSASDVAREEFPDLDLTVRGAISIARRLQDPLAELVKIDPKSIGVGQYQHDVQQTLLARKLAEVVESCVNRVGVELNTASAPLLSHVAGIGRVQARKIIEHRERHGAFDSRAQLLKVSGLGPRTFEQAAGFLRVRESQNPLDRSAVHPERYTLVEQIAGDMGVELARLVGDAKLAGNINIARWVDDAVGEPTLRDIVNELAKPGRDPRASFEAPRFRDDVHAIGDLHEGMSLEGVVTNVTKFGAFVDLGVHQDGLVHISELSDRWIDDPSQVVKVGDKLKVRVLGVDLERKRIALTAKSHSTGGRGQERQSRGGGKPQGEAESRGEAGRGHAGKEREKGRRDERAAGNFANNPFAKLRR